MSAAIAKAFKSLLHSMGLDVVRYYPPDSIRSLPGDFDSVTAETVLQVQPFTMTSPERLFALCEAVRYISAHQIPGAIVECGVWKGGSMMAAARTLLEQGTGDRDLYLFDTFEGMTVPDKQDVSLDGESALEIFQKKRQPGIHSNWCYAPLEGVQAALYTTGYDPQKLHFIQGRVEDTIPARAPEEIALLRLDTDWYESTRHELIHLFPRIVPGGVIIIDDYGYWQGARKAVDEYFQTHQVKILLNRIDLTGRIGIVR